MLTINLTYLTINLTLTLTYLTLNINLTLTLTLTLTLFLSLTLTINLGNEKDGLLSVLRVLIGAVRSFSPFIQDHGQF
jgi:hypothetical protein